MDNLTKRSPVHITITNLKTQNIGEHIMLVDTSGTKNELNIEIDLKKSISTEDKFKFSLNLKSWNIVPNPDIIITGTAFTVVEAKTKADSKVIIQITKIIVPDITGINASLRFNSFSPVVQPFSVQAPSDDHKKNVSVVIATSWLNDTHQLKHVKSISEQIPLYISSKENDILNGFSLEILAKETLTFNADTKIQLFFSFYNTVSNSSNTSIFENSSFSISDNHWNSSPKQNYIEFSPKNGLKLEQRDSYTITISNIIIPSEGIQGYMAINYIGIPKVNDGVKNIVFAVKSAPEPQDLLVWSVGVNSDQVDYYKQLKLKYSATNVVSLYLIYDTPTGKQVKKELVIDKNVNHKIEREVLINFIEEEYPLNKNINFQLISKGYNDQVVDSEKVEIKLCFPKLEIYTSTEGKTKKIDDVNDFHIWFFKTEINSVNFKNAYKISTRGHVNSWQFEEKKYTPNENGVIEITKSDVTCPVLGVNRREIVNTYNCTIHTYTAEGEPQIIEGIIEGTMFFVCL